MDGNSTNQCVVALAHSICCSVHKRVRFSVVAVIVAHFTWHSLHKLVRFSVVVSGLQESVWLCVSVGATSHCCPRLKLVFAVVLGTCYLVALFGQA